MFCSKTPKSYRNDLRSMDVAYCRLLRSVVGPPRNADWTLPWHNILHTWKKRIRGFTMQTTSKPLSEMRLRHHSNLAQYFATRPGHRGSKGLKLGSQRPRNHARKNFVNNRTVGDVMFQKPIGFRGWCTTFIGSSLCGRPFVVRRICRTTSVHA